MFRRLLCGGALAAAMLAAGAAPKTVPDDLAQRVRACTACHGAQGRAAPDGYYPRIAGKPAGYLFHQLQNFRDGRRRYGPMVQLVDPLSDGYLREIAAHFAAIELPYPAPAPASGGEALRARGQRLVHEGDPTRDLPACQACHGEALMGVKPAVPGLLGLPRDYLLGQLGAWASGERRAHAPDCMAQVAKTLTPDDASAIAAWLAAQPVPPGAKPAEALPQAMPLRCGGVTP